MSKPSPTPHPLTIRLHVPGQLVNPLNARRHWTESAREAKRWRERTWVAWQLGGKPTWQGPAHFTFTAYTARRWDDAEGHIAACKSIRDEIVKLISGTDDSPAAGHRFSYVQRVCPPGHPRGVLVEVTPLIGGTT